VTVQVEVPVVAGASVQVLDGAKVPLAPPLLKLAVPCGDDFVPESVSVTVAVHVVEPLIGLLAGVHDVEVEVVRRVTLSGNPVASALFAWTESLAA
jgi:hypothetical protein